MASLGTQALRFVAEHVVPRLGPARFVLAPLADRCTFSAGDAPAPYLVHDVMHRAMTALCRYLAVAATFTSALAAQRIDTHIHALPPAYVRALEAAGGDPSGYPSPNWTLDATIESMDLFETSVGELPSPPIQTHSQN